MASQVGYTRKTVKVSHRDFLVQTVPYDNGNFISISEGLERIGALVVSISSSGRVSTADVIPSKSDTLFLQMVAEHVSTTINGICIFSLNIEKDLDLDSMKVLMNELMEIVEK